jgi:hypothetical protein
MKLQELRKLIREEVGIKQVVNKLLKDRSEGMLTGVGMKDVKEYASKMGIELSPEEEKEVFNLYSKSIKGRVHYIDEAKKVQFKEYDDYGQEVEEGVFSYRDGWSKQTLEGIGVLDWIQEVEGVAYEIKNARRGSYTIDGDDDRALLQTFVNLKHSLDDIIQNMSSIM